MGMRVKSISGSPNVRSAIFVRTKFHASNRAIEKIAKAEKEKPKYSKQKQQSRALDMRI